MKTDIKKWCCIGGISALVYCICGVAIYRYFSSRKLFSEATKYGLLIMGIEFIIYIIYFIFSLRKQNDIRYLTLDITYGVSCIIIFNAMIIRLDKIGYIKETQGFLGGLELVWYVLLNYLVFSFIIFFRILITGMRKIKDEEEKVGTILFLCAFILIPILYRIFIFICSIWDTVTLINNNM